MDDSFDSFVNAMSSLDECSVAVDQVVVVARCFWHKHGMFVVLKCYLTSAASKVDGSALHSNDQQKC